MRELATGALEPRSEFSHRAQASAMRLTYGFLNRALAALAWLRWPRSRPAQAANICVFRIGNIGDIVCALPALRAVREAYPKARLTLLTSPGKRGMPGAAELLDGVEWIDEIIVYHGDEIGTVRQRAGLLLKLRARRFDAWVELPQNLSSPLRQFRDLFFTALVGPKWARGWRIHTLRLWAQAQSEFLDFPNEVDRLLRISEEAGFAAPTDPYALPRSRATREAVDRVLGAANGKPIAAVAPGAKRATNAWPLERFGEVGAYLAGQGYSVVLLGAEGDRQACGRIAALVGPQGMNLAGSLTLTESWELLRRCRLVVCVDSGVQHLAAAVGTPCVSLFSFWQLIGKWRPHGDRNLVIQKWVPCHTCYYEVCPHENACMKAISAEEVIDAARSLERAPAQRALAGGGE